MQRNLKRLYKFYNPVMKQFRLNYLKLKIKDLKKYKKKIKY